MLRLIRFLFTGDWHLHQWEEVRHINVYDVDDTRQQRLPMYHTFVLKCKHCGNMKKFNAD